MVTFRGLGASLLGLASIAAAQTSTYRTPVDLVVAANVPASGNDLYLQIQAPADSGWAGVGFGARMRGSLIFVIYPTSDGKNITVSPRIATANEMPNYESSIDFTTLSGTGIADGLWTANILCRNCRRWSLGSVNVKSTSQPFIWAVGTGQRVFSNSPSERINQHASRSSFSLDLVRATGGNSGNPFDSNTNPNNGTGTDNGGQDGTNNPDENDGGKDLGSGNLPLTKADRVLIAHGVLMATAFLILYPLGSLTIHFLAPYLPAPPFALYAHITLQAVSLILTITGFALGLNLRTLDHIPPSSTHRNIGIIVLTFLLLQLPLGWTHHAMYKKNGGKRTWVGGVHRYNGRIAIALGIVNGGIGLDVAGIKKTVLGGIEVGLVEKYWVVVYAVVAGVMGLAYLCGWGLVVLRRKRKNAAGNGEAGKEGTLLQQQRGYPAGSQRSEGGSSHGKGKEPTEEPLEMPMYNPSGRIQAQDYYVPRQGRQRRGDDDEYTYGR